MKKHSMTLGRKKVRKRIETDNYMKKKERQRWKHQIDLDNCMKKEEKTKMKVSCNYSSE